MHEIRIGTHKVEMLGTLNESPTAERIWDALPIDSTVNTWGQEIYFSIPVQCDLGLEARDRMEVGELGYWPTGSAFCIFFGRTPASKGDEPRAASPVNPIGRCEGDIKVFRQVREGDAIRIEAVEEVAEEPPAQAEEAGEPEPPAEAEAETGEAAQEPDATEPVADAGEPEAAEAAATDDAQEDKPAEEA
ncbi:MAG TPA: cyclophilin-like fold protein [Phycisphaerae bacterium]|nr:cyclophilin-like fold protein [Phycisphaerae bacterium]